MKAQNSSSPNLWRTLLRESAARVSLSEMQKRLRTARANVHTFKAPEEAARLLLDIETALDRLVELQPERREQSIT